MLSHGTLTAFGDGAFRAQSHGRGRTWCNINIPKHGVFRRSTGGRKTDAPRLRVWVALILGWCTSSLCINTSVECDPRIPLPLPHGGPPLPLAAISSGSPCSRLAPMKESAACPITCFGHCIRGDCGVCKLHDFVGFIICFDCAAGVRNLLSGFAWLFGGDLRFV